MKELQPNETERRLTWSINDGVYWLLRQYAAKTRVSMKEALESAITTVAGHTGTYLVQATCPSCEAAMAVSTSGRSYLGGPGSHTEKLSESALVLAEAYEVLRAKNPAAAEAVEALVRSL